ncbi:hypothetical protein D3C73_1412800 [compost metagenome]
MQIGEEDVVFVQQGELGRLQLLDLHDHVAAGENRPGVRRDAGARLDVVGVGKARA